MTSSLARIAARPDSAWRPHGRGSGLERADGAFVHLSDGRAYIDLVNGKGSVLLGHNHPAPNRAIQAHLASSAGCTSGWTDALFELAETIADDAALPDGQIAFFSTGTEAVRAAAYAARASTGRPLVLSAGYHGWDPMWRPGPGLLEPSAHGVIDFFFVPELLERALAAHRERVALVALSPDYIHLRPDTLRALIELARAAGALICCDDVKQGYRYAPGASLPALCGARADLYTFSKGLANGHRISCAVGPRAVMREMKDFTYTAYFDPVPAVAARATLAEMRARGGYQILFDTGARVVSRLRESLAAAQLPLAVHGSGPLFQFVAGNDALEDALHARCFERGLLLYEGDNQALSLAFDEAVVDELIRRFTDALDDLCLQFSHLRGRSIDDDRLADTAWHVMDGVTDRVAPEVGRRAIARAMGWPQPAA